MDLIGNDTYMIKENRSLNISQMDSLMNLYQPLMSSLAICLYLTLLKMPISTKKFDTHTSLCAKLKCTIDVLLSVRQELEHFSLLNVYIKKNETFNIYIYEIKSPMPAVKFLRHEIYSRLLMQEMGKTYVKNFIDDSSNMTLVSDMENITRIYIMNPSEWNSNDEKDFQKIVSKMPKLESDNHSIYDFGKYAEQNCVNEFVFPFSKIRADDMHLINYYGAKYTIEKAEMLKIFDRTYNRKTDQIDREKFTTACIRVANKGKVIDIKEKSYDLESMDFFLYVEPKREFSLTNQELNDIKTIRERYKFSNEMINFVLEKTYTNTEDHVIPLNYMDKVAKTLLDAKVNNVKEAKLLYEKNDFFKFKNKGANSAYTSSHSSEARVSKTNNKEVVANKRGRPELEYEPVKENSSDLNVDKNSINDKLKALLKKEV